MSREVAVVPHSHWDREWYAPFESYRVRLVSMMDALVELLESGSLPHFHLDGQVAALDDYLEVRPERRDRLAALITDGRLAVGPWYVLMDEFCVSGETVLRNLEIGLDRAATLGAREFCGYLPDMFGHMAQMPQVLAQAGIDHAVVWRGVPAAVEATAFPWEAPDGSRVLAEYLPVGYASGAFLPQDTDGLLRRVAAHETEIARFLGPDRALLLMNGGDHQSAQAWVPGLLEEANRAQDRFRFRITSLAAYLTGRPDSEAPVVAGELRSGARAPLLMGVLSNRVDVKQAAARAEAALERVAEPLATLWLPPDLWPADRMEAAWRLMILNSAHDSICACSADPVGRAVLSRYDAVAALTSSVTTEALSIAGVATATGGAVVVNPLPDERDGLVELELPGMDPRPGTQLLQARQAGVTERHGRGGDLGRILAELAEEGHLGTAGRPEGAELSPPGEPLTVTLHADATRPADPLTAPVMAEAWARAGAGREEPLTVRVVRVAGQRLLAHARAVPGWGWATLEPGLPPSGPVAADDGIMDNGLLRVAFSPDGLVSLAGLRSRVEGLNRITEEPDEGDTYNFCPPCPPGRAGSQDGPADFQLVEQGPLRAVMRVTRTLRWPGPVTVVSDVELRAGEAVVRLRTGFDHTGRDHRIRAVFPLPHPATTSVAECAFGPVERGEAEGGPQEPALATFPSRRFVSAGGLTVFHEGLLEYELVEGRELALTLLRAVGVLSRPAPRARPNVAGPALELVDTQLPGPRVFRYSVGLDVGDPWAVADHLGAPLAVVAGTGGGPLADRGQRLPIDLGGARVSALRRRQGRIEIRLFNPRPEPVTVSLPGQAGDLVDLRGRPTGRWAGRIELGPRRLATARLDRADLDRADLDR